MRNRRLKSIALFSGHFFVLLLLVSTQLYAIAAPVRNPEPAAVSAGPTGTAEHYLHFRGKFSAARSSTQHSRMNGKAGHNDKHRSETDLFAGANKAGAPSASQALVSD